MSYQDIYYNESYENILLCLASLPSYDYDKDEKEWNDKLDANNIDNQTLNNENIEEEIDYE